MQTTDRLSNTTILCSFHQPTSQPERSAKPRASARDARPEHARVASTFLAAVETNAETTLRKTASCSVVH